jgi:hypothetical protein
MSGRRGNKWDKTIFVRWLEPDSNDAAWREVSGDPKSFAETGETVTIGEYKLVGVRKVSTKVEVKGA